MQVRPAPPAHAADTPETFLDGLPVDARAALLASATTLEFEAGARIFADQDAHVGVVLDGVVRTYLVAGDGRQFTVRYAPHGAMIGRRSDVTGDHTPLLVQALSRCTVLEFSVEALFGLVSSDAVVSMALVRELARRMEDIYDTVAANAFGTLRERIARHLLSLARADRDGRVIAAVTQQQLADSVGTAREVAARVLGGLRADGLIETRRAEIEIRDADRLASLVGGWR